MDIVRRGLYRDGEDFSSLEVVDLRKLNEKGKMRSALKGEVKNPSRCS